MYSHEIKSMLEKQGNIISREEYDSAFNPNISTQIKYIKYDDKEDSFLVLTNDNYLFSFKVVDIEKSNVKVKKCK